MRNTQHILWVFVTLSLSLLWVSNLNAQQFKIDDEGVRGVISTQQQATITSELTEKVSKTPILSGESFSKGDVLLEFNCAVRIAEAAAGDAAYKAAKARYDNNLEMKSFDAAGAFDVAIAKAEKDEAQARTKALHARNKSCVIKAPYDGKMAELYIHQHEAPKGNQPLLRIVGHEQLELKLIVPSKWLVWMKKGGELSFKVDETGATHKAQISTIGAEVDAVSRTVAIFARFVQAPENLLPGMSGFAYFDRDTG